MKKVILYSIILPLLLAGCRRNGTDSNGSLDLSSVDAFYETVALIKSGEVPTPEQWDALYKTKGYGVFLNTEELRRAHRDAMLLTFDPSRTGQRDSMLALTGGEVYTSQYNYTTRMTLENFMDMQDHWDELAEFREGYDFTPFYPEAVARLAQFLAVPESEVEGVADISLLCYEYDAHSRGDNITMDFNMFFRQTPEENTGFMAHEMFHSYRNRIQGEEYREWLYSDAFLFAIDRAADEGIADLIDKPDDVPAYFRSKGFAEVLVEIYETAYPATPDLLARLDSLTTAHADDALSAEDFQNALRGYFVMGGHPNGLYMARVVERAGLRDELISGFTSPFEFFRIYNRAAKGAGEYVFSDTFLRYLDTREAAGPHLYPLTREVNQ
ncbi:MAG: hypothetical protein LIO85_08500 [Rikenellaceae bacterium]|nr:hypothetical protein [Rikenellaceae bacterium]